MCTFAHMSTCSYVHMFMSSCEHMRKCTDGLRAWGQASYSSGGFDPDPGMGASEVLVTGEIKCGHQDKLHTVRSDLEPQHQRINL